MPRHYNHDYKSRCIYHITLKKIAEAPPFSYLSSGVADYCLVRNPIGSIIEKHIRRLPELNPSLRPLQYCVMPDHVHLLLFVTSPIDLPVGNYIGKLKNAILQEYRLLSKSESLIFDHDFYDCILHRGRSLDTLYKYIRDNPRRLAVRHAHPEFFRRVNELKIGERTYQAYGNFQLLDNPFKEQVIVHRADTPETRRHNRELWLYTAANGGVLVSPFISPYEKAIRAEAEESGGRIILIINRPIDSRYKPIGHDFDLCESGRLLIISANLDDNLNRSACLTMNSLAEEICKEITSESKSYNY